MKPSLELLYVTTYRERIAAGDHHDLAQSAAVAAVHRAGMLDAAEIADSEPTRGGLYIAAAIRRAAGGEK